MSAKQRWATKVVQETLGHSTVGLTLDTYTSVYTEVAPSPAATGPSPGISPLRRPPRRSFLAPPAPPRTHRTHTLPRARAPETQTAGQVVGPTIQHTNRTAVLVEGPEIVIRALRNRRTRV
jgi:hypothetical protein